MHCRDLKSVRACLTYFKRLFAGEVLDFERLVFIDPGAMVLMHHFARLNKRASSIILPKRPLLQKLMNESLQLPRGGRLRLRSPNSFPLRYVETESAMIEGLSAWRDMLMQSGACDEPMARDYSATMTEVLQNSFTHGKTRGHCIVAGQTFPKKKHSTLVA